MRYSVSLIAFPLSPIARRAARALGPLALVAGLTVTTALGATLFLHAPAQDRLARAQVSYETARQVQVRQQSARKIQEDLAGVWRALPVRREFPALILAISELAQQEGIAIPGMNYSLQKTEEGLPQKATITFRVAGEYPAIRRFLHRIETADLYLVIESLDASRPSEVRRTGVVFNVRVVTYLRPDEPATTSGRA